MRTVLARTSWLAAAAIALIAATAGGAAASIGGVGSAALTATALAGASGAPTVAVWENFDGVNNTNLNGTLTDGGAKTWAAVRGTWRINTNRARSTSANAALVVTMGQPNAAVEATLVRGTTAWNVGVTANMNAARTQYLTAEWTSNASGSIELWAVNGTRVSLGSVTNLYPGGLATAPASLTLRLNAVGPALVVAVNGTVVLNVTLSVANQTTFKNVAHPFFGTYAYFDAVSSIDNFHIDL